MEIAVLALGCFWGPEKKYGQLEGVYKTEVGYCGGNSPNTNYREVCTGTTNHAEAVLCCRGISSEVSRKKIECHLSHLIG